MKNRKGIWLFGSEPAEINHIKILSGMRVSQSLVHVTYLMWLYMCVHVYACAFLYLLHTNTNATSKVTTL